MRLWTPVLMTIQMMSSEMNSTDGKTAAAMWLLVVCSYFRPDIPLEDSVCCSGTFVVMVSFLKNKIKKL